MDIALLTNAAVNLVIGAALLIVWKRNPTQKFTAALALSCLAQLLSSASYIAVRNPDPLISKVGVLLVCIGSSAYLTLMIFGVRHLAGKEISAAAGRKTFLALVVCFVIGASLTSNTITQGLFASSLTVVGLLSSYWLSRGDSKDLTARPFVGALIVLLGLNQFIFVFLGDAGTALQASIGVVLRVALGLAIFGAAVQVITLEAKRMQSRFERLSESSAQGIVIVQDRYVVYSNPASRAIYGIDSPGNMNLRFLSQYVPKNEWAKVSDCLNKVQMGQADNLTYEALWTKITGEPIWLRLQYFRTEWDGSPAVQVLISDETERHHAAKALELKSMQDELTGLPNRAALLALLADRCQDTQSFALILLDVDRFKAFNESNGYALGDSVLQSLATALRAGIDSDHAVMRLGEDEFAIVTALGSNQTVAQDVADTVIHMLSRPLPVGPGEFFLDCSLGISVFPQDGTTPNTLLRSADSALDSAKDAPGASYRFARPEAMPSGAAFEQEQALRAGFARSEFHLLYQPKVDSTTLKLTSFEALARWERPGHGMVSPMEFISVAERIGMIGALGAEFLRQACAQIAHWQATVGRCVPVAVNVSPLQMLDSSFPSTVASILKETGIPPELLTLEITESSAVQNLESTIQQVKQLRFMGVHVAMDDFGTGFSSLNMLRTLPLHTIKIDRGLIDPLPQAESVAVVRAISQLADALKLHVVAEGVETQAQAISARDAGCGELQGYLFSRPLTAEAATGWISSF